MSRDEPGNRMAGSGGPRGGGVLDPEALDAFPDYPLARFDGARPPAPAWYEALRNRPPERLRVVVEGAGIEVLAWGRRGRPGILLIHGNRAHAQWWGPVAPLLARHYRVAAFSLSGMGGSDWRARYSSAQHAREAAAAIAVAGLGLGDVAPIIAAHSFGAVVAAAAMRAEGAALSGIAFVDSFVVPPTMRSGEKAPPATSRSYPDLPSALARFRLSPSQPGDAPYILDDVARAGLAPTADGGWRWRFDPHFLGKLVADDPWEAVSSPACPIGFVYGERSALATPPILAAQRAGTPPGTPSIGIADAWHHVMFDRPLALLGALRTLAALWFPAPIQTGTIAGAG